MALRDLGVKEYTYTEVQKLVYSVKNANPRTIIEELTKVDKALSTAKDRYRRAKLKGIVTTIEKYAKKGMSKSKRVKAKDNIGAYGNDFFIAANKLMKLFFDLKKIKKNVSVKKNITTQELLDAQEKMDSMKSLTKEEYKEVFEELDESTKKIIKELTALENATEAGNPFVLGLPNLLLGLDTMSLEELSKLELDLKEERLGFAEQLKEKIELEKEANNKLKAESAKQIQGNWDMLYEDADVEEDGKTVTKKVPIHDNTISPSLLEVLTQKGLKAALNKLRESIKISKKAVNFLGHLGTIMNTLDNIPAGDNFFTENIYNRLNRAIQRHVKGMQSQVEKLNDIAASINPNLTYDKIKTEIFNTATLKIPSRIKEAYGKKTVQYLEATGDSQMRIYALSKNEIQRQKLRNMGYTDQVLLDIENNLDPDVKAFADKIVDYLSDDNFNRLDNVFRDVNNIGLNKIDNYFPTRTIHKRANRKDNLANVQNYAEGNFQQGFNAQHGSFLKNRVDLAGEIQLIDPNYETQIGFTSELDTHLDGVERYIAFAQDVKILNRLFKSEDVVNLLQKTRLYKLTNQLINNTVNPIPATALPWFRKIISNFVGFKIGFKLWQIPKQASSFVMSFPEYTNAKTSHLPRAAEIAANIPLYIADQIAVMATFRSSLKEAKAASPMLRERIMSFERAGFGALETAIEEGDISKNKRIEKIFNAINKAGGYPTHIGDLLGVMGYWAVYKRDIENGMNPTKALEKFENYNKTQQSRRATEINQWQLKSREHPFYLMATTFASMPLLLANQVMSSSNNMTKIIAQADSFPKGVMEALGSPDGLRFLFALGVGNALFVATSNMFKFYGGDEEEREEVLIDVAAAAVGWNNLLSIPIFKSVVEEAGSLFKDKQYGRSDLMNPIVQGFKDYKKMAKAYESKGFSKTSLEAARLFAGYSKGINLEPIISLLYYQDLFGGIGVSKSYLAKKQQRKK